MAFTLEDGTGIAGANAYISAAFADAYFTERGIAAWIGTNTVKEQAIVRATDYVEKRFAGLWRGLKLTQAQGLSWPRRYATDQDGYLIDGLPLQLKQAVAEYSLRALTATLLPDPGTDANVIRKAEAVGPISEETEWATPTSMIPAYPAADRMLRGITIPGGAIRN